MEVDTIGELCVPQLDEFAVAGNLALLQLQYREEIHRAGLVFEQSDSYSFAVIAEGAFRDRQAFRKEVFIGQRCFDLGESDDGHFAEMRNGFLLLRDCGSDLGAQCSAFVNGNELPRALRNSQGFKCSKSRSLSLRSPPSRVNAQLGSNANFVAS